ncbi:MAG: polysaccharide deacetylase family protein [Methylovulum sp.]|nr:polysaccharide deacetylase family protein [Methylovulum sp.]
MQHYLFSLLKHCATLASYRFTSKKLFILIYHRVLDAPDFMRPGEPDKVAFAWQMELLTRYFNVLPLAEALARLQNNSLPPRAVTITFDDGYADNFYNAMPILKQQQLPATFFIASGYLDGGRMWSDSVIETIRNFPDTTLNLNDIGLGVFSLASEEQKVAAARTILNQLKYQEPLQRLAHSRFIADQVSHLPDDLMLTSTQLQALHAQGMEIGGHTVNHPILATLDDAKAKAEIADNKAFLEQKLGVKLRFFAYPNGKLGGDYQLRHRDIVRQCHYQASLSTHAGVADNTSDIWQLPRFTPWDATPLKFMLRMVRMYCRQV